VTDGVNRNGNPMSFPQDLPGSSGCPVRKGRLYAIDERGKLMWPAPVAIEEQRFLLNQPERLPVVAFASLVHEQRPNGAWIPKALLLCVDKRTGRVLYRQEMQRSMSYPALDIVGDAEKKTVELRLHNGGTGIESVTLAFTDKPIPPAPAGKSNAGDVPKRSKLSDALWKAVDRSIKGDEE
jgi:hypothetical protein